MRKFLKTLNRIKIYADRTNNFIGKYFSWLTLFCVAVVFFTVVQRYVFDMSFTWQSELALFLHSIVFLACAGYGLKTESHVRVDVFYQKLSPKGKAIINIIGVSCLLIPVCAALLYFSKDYLWASWKLKEKSAEFGGMPGVFIIKTFIWVWCLTLIMQGVSLVIKSIFIIKRSR